MATLRLDIDGAIHLSNGRPALVHGAEEVGQGILVTVRTAARDTDPFDGSTIPGANPFSQDHGIRWYTLTQSPRNDGLVRALIAEPVSRAMGVKAVLGVDLDYDDDSQSYTINSVTVRAWDDEIIKVLAGGGVVVGGEIT